MKILLISHENDIDGIGNVVLAKLAFDELDYLLYPSVSTLEENFRELANSNALASYDKVYITDLALADPALEMVASSPPLKDKVLIFDHHEESVKKGLDRFDFTKIEEKSEDGHKRCGTEMFYEYLLEKNLFASSSVLKDFVELTRLEDTWEWKNAGEYGQKAHDLAILFSAIGIEDYISSMYAKVTSKDEVIALTDKEKAFVLGKKREYEAKLQSLWEETEIFEDEEGNLFGAVFADYEYRNELAEYIRKQEDQRGIKYIIIIALEKGANGQKSYRSIEPDFDVNAIASLHGGGGHTAAAAVNITEEQKGKCLTLQKRDSLSYLSSSKFTQ